jgi:hypothetical protein
MPHITTICDHDHDPIVLASWASSEVGHDRNDHGNTQLLKLFKPY